MSTHPQRQYSVEDYLMVEEGSSVRHEYFDGEIFAMAGGTVAHNQACSNVLAALSRALEKAPWRALGSDMRLLTPRGLLTYPDVMVICRQVQTALSREDIVTNPILLVEVLSDATRNYDRGEKFGFYREIPSFREYLVIDPKQPLIEHHRRADDVSWTTETHSSLDGTISLPSIAVVLSLDEIYRKVLDPA